MNSNLLHSWILSIQCSYSYHTSRSDAYGYWAATWSSKEIHSCPRSIWCLPQLPCHALSSDVVEGLSVEMCRSWNSLDTPIMGHLLFHKRCAYLKPVLREYLFTSNMDWRVALFVADSYICLHRYGFVLTSKKDGMAYIDAAKATRQGIVEQEMEHSGWMSSVFTGQASNLQKWKHYIFLKTESTG